ncbi:MAG: hypothetical protein RSN88_10995 [Gordonibacter sp.]|uniref:hypothetical protein n=1 Tax=Gordonibacter sp. TaxID=1968902 RepID=UPI002FC5F75D
MGEIVEILRSEIGVGKPILTSEILRAYEDTARSSVFEKIEASLQAGDLARFDRGVYYIPESSIVPGLNMPLNPESVLRKKYIRDGAEVYGFRSGLTLLNDRGVSNQVPAVLEITTNRSPRRVYSVKPIGGYREILLRKPRVLVCAGNVIELEFLDALGLVDSRTLNPNEYEALMKMLNSCNRRILFNAAQNYPTRTMINLMRIEAECAVPA